MSTLNIAGIGELLWDILPEAENLGGAPANFAYHVNALGATGLVVSTVGSDQRGRRALQLLEENGLDTSCISVSQRFPTGYVKAELDDSGKATYAFPDNVAWDHLQLNDEARRCQASLSGVCFGTLGQRSETARATIQSFLQNCPPGALRICDLNLRQQFYTREIIETSLDLATILKLNDEELDTLAPLLGLPAAEQGQLEHLISHYHLDLVILTRGDRGSILQSSTERSDHPGLAAETKDTIGAGDSFTAATAVGLLLDLPLGQINERANQLAAYVCSQPGAMPPVPARYRYLP